ncbi:hypothetical protein Fmac_032996 [Flemingia macrophylla]|uniref:Uncharacterized protein n=1 Tax=Flemingia macrophylla TaxID=520843 RepID=A0ABD1L6I0_9FABA
MGGTRSSRFSRAAGGAPDTTRQAATSRFRNFNPIPFRSTRSERYQTGFPRPLGSTNPCASVICTDERFARARAPGFAATAAPSYSSGPGPCPDGRVSAQLGTVTQLPVHPTSPLLLTKNGPLGALDSVARLNKAAAPSYLFKSDERFARQYRCGPPPKFPLASPRSGIVHHISGPDRYALNRTLHRRSGSIDGATHKGIPPISFLAPYGFTRPLTRTHVRLLRLCFKTGRMGSPQADARSAQVPRHAMAACAAFHNRDDDVSASISTARAWATVTIRIGHCPEPIGGLALTIPHLTETHLFSFGQNLPPDWGCIPKQPDLPTAPCGATGFGHDGALTFSGAPFQGTWAWSATEDASPYYNSDAKGDRFSWWALPDSLAVTKGILNAVSGSAVLPLTILNSLAHGAPGFVFCQKRSRPSKARHDRLRPDSGEEGAPLNASSRPNGYRQTGSPVQLISRGIDNDPSAGSPTETLLRLLLPLNDKVQWTSHNVTGSEPPTSPQSEHFTELFNR